MKTGLNNALLPTLFTVVNNIEHCYIASVNTKRDWLICGHVTSDKCNVSRRATSEKLLPAPTGHVHK
jgi:hypothetical protein